MTSINTALNFAGSVAIIRASARENADGISIIENRLPCGYATPLHVHLTQDEAFHIQRGRMRFEVGGKTIVGEAGDVLTAPKGIPHRFIVESPEGAAALVILRGPDFETFVLESASPLATSFTEPLPKPTDADMARLMQAAANSKIEILGPPLAA